MPERRVTLPPLPKLLSKSSESRLVDALIFVCGLAVLYGVLQFSSGWLTPFTSPVEISRRVSALPGYAAYSLMRIAFAYLLSLAFALAYGYTAAHSKRAAQFMIPLLDVLQSIPVLSFLPGVMLAMVALFPHSRVGVELGAIVLIFTGMVWNLAFSFYSSLRSIPQDLLEVCRICRMSWWQRFAQLELPYSMFGLVWNSMMSVAGGWFFLMSCEMFVLGQRDFRLPGLGSFLQTAAGDGDTGGILWGLAAMIGVIVLLDLALWRPVIAWADKFKFEQVESAAAPHSAILDLLGHSRVMAVIRKRLWMPLAEGLTLYFARHQPEAEKTESSVLRTWLLRLTLPIALLVVGLGAVRALAVLHGLTQPEVLELARGAGTTFLRVIVALIVAALWTIPAGVAIGSSPRLARVAQPLAEIAASVPATALFPVVLLIIISRGGGMNTASLLLIILGTQWYILFNVIAGAMALPSDLREVVRVFHFSSLERWRRLILPGIFPYLITGMVTAAGGAWNASIIAEYFKFGGRILATRGLGATISQASDAGNFDLLLAATLVMALMVVTVNRLLWRRLYRLAETRFKLEG